MFKHTALLVAFGLTLALPVHAETWLVDIDTTPHVGANGYLDLQLNPGASDAQAVQVKISNFSTDGTLGAYLADGAVSGSLSGLLILDNSEALNAWLQQLAFGSHIAFTLDIDAALDAGSGSSFSAQLLDADFNPLLASADAALHFELMPGAAPSWLASSNVQVSAVPEPSVPLSLLAGLGLMSFVIRRNQRSPGFKRSAISQLSSNTKIQ